MLVHLPYFVMPLEPRGMPAVRLVSIAATLDRPGFGGVRTATFEHGIGRRRERP